MAACRILLHMLMLLVLASEAWARAAAETLEAPTTAAPTSATAAAGAADGTASGGTGLITIDHVIDDSQDAYLRRALADAHQRQCSRILIHFRTDGGTLDAGRHMLSQLLELSGPQHPQLIAYVDDHCYSAGAMIAYGCDRIYLSSHASIGDIGVIFYNSDGTMAYAPEKQQTVVRTLLRSAAQSRGWDPARLQKMTALNQRLYRFELAPGRSDQDAKSGKSSTNAKPTVVYVLEDDLNQFLHDHPEIDSKDLPKYVVADVDRLLTYTGLDAVSNGMASGLADDLGALEAQLHIDPQQVIDLGPSGIERMAWMLAGWAPLMAAGAALCLFLEFKYGGTGIFLILAAVCGGAFLACQYYQELASYPEALLMLGGVVLIALELFVFPTAGWLLITGLVLGCSGLILAFMPDADQFTPSAPEWGGQLLRALMRSLLALIMIFAGMVGLIAGLPRSPLMRRLAVQVGDTGMSASAQAVSDALIGKRASARTDLGPTGKIRIDGQDYSATSETSAFLPAGTEVEVVAMRFGEAVVRRAGSPAT